MDIVHSITQVTMCEWQVGPISLHTVCWIILPYLLENIIRINEILRTFNLAPLSDFVFIFLKSPQLKTCFQKGTLFFFFFFFFIDINEIFGRVDKARNFMFEKSWFQNSAHGMLILTEHLSCFPEAIQADAGMIPQSNNCSSLSHSLNSIVHQSPCHHNLKL
jgi:hypothetical protein